MTPLSLNALNTMLDSMHNFKTIHIHRFYDSFMHNQLGFQQIHISLQIASPEMSLNPAEPSTQDRDRKHKSPDKDHAKEQIEAVAPISTGVTCGDTQPSRLRQVWNHRFANTHLNQALPRVLWPIISDYLIDLYHYFDRALHSSVCNLLDNSDNRKLDARSTREWSWLPAIAAHPITERIPEFTVVVRVGKACTVSFMIGLVDSTNLSLPIRYLKDILSPDRWLKAVCDARQSIGIPESEMPFNFQTDRTPMVKITLRFDFGLETSTNTVTGEMNGQNCGTLFRLDTDACATWLANDRQGLPITMKAVDPSRLRPFICVWGTDLSTAEIVVPPE